MEETFFVLTSHAILLGSPPLTTVSHVVCVVLTILSGRGRPDVFECVIITSHPLGHGVGLRLGHVFLTREPQAFPWPCQAVVSTSGYEGRNIELHAGGSHMMTQRTPTIA